MSFEKILLKYLEKKDYHEISSYETALQKSFKNLNKLIPLVETIDDKADIISPWELIVATVLYFSGNLFENQNDFYKNSSGTIEYKREQLKKILINFIKYSINIFSFYEKVRTTLSENPTSKNTIWNLRNRGGTNNDPFIVVPTIDFERQYAANAVDLRLGNSFITSKLTEFTHIPTKPSDNPLVTKILSISLKSISYHLIKNSLYIPIISF